MAAISGAMLLSSGWSLELAGVTLGFGLGLLPPLVEGIHERRQFLLPDRGGARFPDRLLEHGTVRNLPLGHSGYTVPWALAITRDARTFIHAGYEVQEEPGGTVRMRIERTPQGLVVFVPAAERFTKTSEVRHSGANFRDYLPVSNVVIDEERPSSLGRSKRQRARKNR